ncbi:protein Daple-like isoform X1 [Carica papaya]|uniref:protein Daple-like isoform X1 n=1 Tax=Carica papaya TaxID=3649 RepID=UPI000B8CDFA1|nr:protein Daple-like isoform X1 [Carica papaya]XP_021893235.1 protein Daple-like isoform X1 [Carica papaya]XP_021893236.1 protein Daple-like isoform X1 [Carica papaya]XP_021893237.1 protein Daple-like isoform X1 [Carica papaya]XP_021893238.1 protein Daple-like isoform X1 [Carica papaya]
MSTRSSSSSRSDADNFFDVEELLQIGTRCRELRKEKDMLRESQSQSFELIRKLELHEKSLSEARLEDKKHIQELERELKNCSQEIDYLQDQLNASNTEVNYLSEHVWRLESKLADMEILQDQINHLRNELRKSTSRNFQLVQELKSKEVELQHSRSCIEKLEESISVLSLESQCEIESMKLEILALEQTYFESEKVQEENVQEKARMSELIEELQVKCQNAQENIKYLDEENKEVRQRLVISEMNAKAFCQKIELWLENNDKAEVETESKLTISEEMRSTCGEALNAVLSKLALVLASGGDFKEKLESVSLKMSEYELHVKKLKDELREEKLKAKEEAEDLAQEMAELRYKMTGLLEEECKRRACIEQASLLRIAELEAQIKKEQKKFFSAVGQLHET